MTRPSRMWFVLLVFTSLCFSSWAADKPAKPAAKPVPSLPQTPAPVALTYLYSAQLANPSKVQGGVSAAGIGWQCALARCTASGPWPQPSVSACRALAQQVGPVRSYGHPAKQLNAAQLVQCNAGSTNVAIHAPGPAALLAQKPIPKAGGFSPEAPKPIALAKPQPGSAPAIASAKAARVTRSASRDLAGQNFIGGAFASNKELSGQSFVGVALGLTKDLNGPNFIGATLASSKELRGQNFIGAALRLQQDLAGQNFIGTRTDTR